MKKIGMLTINDYNNYGNRLQNYALQEVLASLNLSVETIVNNTKYKVEAKSPVDLSALGRLKRISGYSPNYIAEKISTKVWEKNNKKLIEDTKKIRYDYFIKFTEKFINETQFSINEDNIIQSNLDDYDYFITGSDQVWNHNYRNGSSIDFLTFTQKNKRISYSASFGISEISEQYIEDYRKWLSEMAFISVREEAGANIVKKLTGRDVPVLVDPTMLLSREDWLSVSKQARNRVDTPYLLTYFLGGPPPETRKKLEKIAKTKNMKIINLGDSTEFETYATGPSEFIDYINNASAFFTDSFHGVIFSIILETPFIVYPRNTAGASMYSRIETILDKFSFKNREVKGFNDDIFAMDFSETHEVLEKEYDKSINYLKEALEIGE